ncbi:hypothetical protein WJX81_001845 [Elliptochloris bilobata]|uniref:Iron-binding zinc finger CDGSH type domain-containing protein n=1 Tax=Elliptochloris bilobata TaxID=381761 RepID=A0AAW1SCB1_9CHLO
MLALAQAVTVAGPCARPVTQGRARAKCTCGKTKTPPNCDGSHARFVETLQTRHVAPSKLGVGAGCDKKPSADEE